MVKKDARVKKVASDEVESSISAGDSSSASSVEPEDTLRPVTEGPYDWRIDAVLVVAFLIMAAYTRFINIGDPKSVIFDEVRRPCQGSFLATITASRFICFLLCLTSSFNSMYFPTPHHHTTTTTTTTTL